MMALSSDMSTQKENVYLNCLRRLYEIVEDATLLNSNYEVQKR